MGVLISPMIVPIVITAVGMYFFYSSVGLANSLPASSSPTPRSARRSS